MAILTDPIPAGDNTIGATRGTSDVIDIVLSLDTLPYATGDVLAATQEIANAVPMRAGHALLHSVVVTDKDDQGAGLDIVFLRTNVSIGAENSAVSISDADAGEILGVIPVAESDFVDLVGCRVATITSVGLSLEAGESSTSLYVAAISRGAGTYTASGIVIKLGMAQRDL
jgi:hypothetical protein